MSNPVFDPLLGEVVKHAHAEIPLAPIVDTRQAILAQSPASQVFARATDTEEIFFWTGSAWVQSPFPTVAASANPDPGYVSDSSRIGVHADYVDNKLLTRVTIGTTYNNTRNGEIYYNPNATGGAGFFGRVAGTFVRLLSGFVFRELAGRFQWQPNGSSEYYDVARLNSTQVGLNGLPMVQDGQVTPGAYPSPLILDGGNAAMDNPSVTTLLLHGTIFRILSRRMTNAERTALTSAQIMAGEIVLESDTGDWFGWDGATWAQLN